MEQYEDSQHIRDNEQYEDGHYMPDSKQQKSGQHNTSLRPFQHYTYPVLESDKLSFAKAKADPLACNINNEMVLLWNDVTIEDNDDVTASGKTLEEASIEEVLDNLIAAVKRHKEDTEAAARDKRNLDLSYFYGDFSKPSTSFWDKSEVGSNRERANGAVVDEGEANTGGDLEQFHSYEHEFNPAFAEPNTVGDSGDWISCDIDLGRNEVETSPDSNSGHVNDTGLAFPVKSQDFSVLTESEIPQLDSGRSESSRFDSGNFDCSSSDYFNSTSRSKTSVDDGEDTNVHTSNSINNFSNVKNKDVAHSTYAEADVVDYIEDFPEVFADEPSPSALEKSCDKDTSYEILKPRTKLPSVEIPPVNVQETLVTCENIKCGKQTTLELARNTYKNCHNCYVAYCSRGCRRVDWERHKTTVCHGSRVNSACKKVLKFCNKDPDVRDTMSRLARRGFISSGRGCVMLGFPDLTAAQEFLEFGFCVLELNPIYVTLKELRASKMFGDVLEKLLKLCEQYKPEVKYVLHVGVGVRWNRTLSQGQGQGQQYGTLDSGYGSLPRNFMKSRQRSGSFCSDGGYGSLNCSLNNPSLSQGLNTSVSNFNLNQFSGILFHDYSGSLARQKGPIIQRCIKLKLSRAHCHAFDPHMTIEEEHRLATTRYGPTLILTGIPGSYEEEDGKRKRELCFINIQRKLRQRGVSLRHQFPLIYASLVKYVTEGAHFPSEIIYPVDTKAKKLFMCVLMPESEPILDWTRSEYLLDDLDISRECIWGSLSRSRSFPSSLHLNHSSFGPASPNEVPTSRRPSFAIMDPNTRDSLTDPLRINREIEVSKALSTSPQTSLQKYHSTPNLYGTDSMTKNDHRQLSPNARSPKALHVGFTCPPDAASSPKFPRAHHGHRHNLPHHNHHHHHGHHRHHHCHHHYPHHQLRPRSHSLSSIQNRPKMSASTENDKAKAKWGSESSSHLLNGDGHTADSLSNTDKNPLLSAEYKRRFNTNSPYFPSDFVFERFLSKESTHDTNNKNKKTMGARICIPTSSLSSFVNGDHSVYVNLPTYTSQDNSSSYFSNWPPSREHVNSIISDWNSHPRSSHKGGKTSRCSHIISDVHKCDANSIRGIPNTKAENSCWTLPLASSSSTRLSSKVHQNSSESSPHLSSDW